MDVPRSSGILLHVSSLPGPFGIGDLGPAAYRFVDFLAETGQQYWQVLPLVPVSYDYSPYASPSTFAGNPLFISPDRLRGRGLLLDEDLAERPAFPTDRVDFERAVPYKMDLLHRAFERFEAHASPGEHDRFEAFRTRNAGWLDDYAAFMVLKDRHDGRTWTEWDPALARRNAAALEGARASLARDIRRRQFWQFLFADQWDALKTYCRERSIRLFGDLPIYVAHDSADVWAHPDLFHLDEDGRPTFVAGVPPDYFSETGQRWGNPLYRWDFMQANGYAWWAQRLRSVLDQVDLLRLDHFRGFEAYWEIPASEATAVHGTWRQGPGHAFFESMHRQLGRLPVVAENLGLITPAVTELMEHFGFPGMAVLQFAFGGGPDSGFLPHNFHPHLIAYTGTHDNDTLVGWWTQSTSTGDVPSPRNPESVARERDHARVYLGLDETPDVPVQWASIRALLASVARLVVVPMQDVLGLGSDARMNTPGRSTGNWAWRMPSGLPTRADADRLRTLTHVYGRAPR